MHLILNGLGKNNWIAPPPRLVADCVRKIKQEKCKCTMVVPIWKSAPFWPILFQGDEIKSNFVHDFIKFQPGKLTKRGRGKNGIFDGRPLKFGLMALRFI